MGRLGGGGGVCVCVCVRVCVCVCVCVCVRHKIHVHVTLAKRTKTKRHNTHTHTHTHTKPAALLGGAVIDVGLRPPSVTPEGGRFSARLTHWLFVIRVWGRRWTEHLALRTVTLQGLFFRPLSNLSCRIAPPAVSGKVYRKSTLFFFFNIVFFLNCI